MTCSKSLSALTAAACVLTAAVNVEAGPIIGQQRQDAPIVAPEIYDPRPGPFFGMVDEQGELKDVGVIANAIQSWAGDRLAAFSLCFQPAAKPIDWKLALSALDSVSLELKTQGAVVVVVHSPVVCPTPPPPSVAGKPYVEITGVIRGRE